MPGLTSVGTIQCVLPYFAPGSSLPLSLAPDSATQELMRQYGLLFRPMNGGGELYCRDAVLLASYTSSQPLSFALYNNDPSLLNYSVVDQAGLGVNSTTDTPLADSLFYADNLQDSGGRLLPDFSGSAIPVRPAVFNQTLAAPVTSASMVLLDALGRQVWEQLSPALPQKTVQVAPRGIPAGRYTLQIGGNAVLDFYLVQQFGPRPFGILAIYPGGPAQSAHMTQGCALIGSGGGLTPQAYSFHLMPRATVWRYHLFSGSQQLGKWQVVASGGGTAPSFTCTNPDAGQAPWIFESQAPIPLAATPDTFQVTLAKPPSPGRNSRVGRKIRLPYALGASLVQPNGDPLGGISDIYVYL